MWADLTYTVGDQDIITARAFVGNAANPVTRAAILGTGRTVLTRLTYAISADPLTGSGDANLGLSTQTIGRACRTVFTICRCRSRCTDTISTTTQT